MGIFSYLCIAWLAVFSGCIHSSFFPKICFSKCSAKINWLFVYLILQCENMDDSVLQCLLSLLSCLNNLFLLLKVIF